MRSRMGFVKENSTSSVGESLSLNVARMYLKPHIIDKLIYCLVSLRTDRSISSLLKTAQNCLGLLRADKSISEFGKGWDALPHAALDTRLNIDWRFENGKKEVCWCTRTKQ